MRRAVLGFALTASFASAGQASLVLRGGRVITVSGEVIEDGSVVIADGKIAAVGRDLTAPAGAVSVDVRGKWIYPGLIDALTNLA